MKLRRFFSRLALLALFVSLAGALYAGELLDPVETIEADGSIALTDGSSYYVFSKGGDFFSGPLGTSGRTLEGRWSEEGKGRFVVTAKRGWLDGLSSESHHRIVLSIGAGQKKPLRNERIPAIMEFATYFLIEEFVEIPDPSKK
jgi:hypothetical protein